MISPRKMPNVNSIPHTGNMDKTVLAFVGNFPKHAVVTKQPWIFQLKNHQIANLYRVTIPLVQNLSLTSRQKFRFGQARTGQAKTELLFWSQQEVLNKWNGHPVYKRLCEHHHLDYPCTHRESGGIPMTFITNADSTMTQPQPPSGAWDVLLLAVVELHSIEVASFLLGFPDIPFECDVPRPRLTLMDWLFP